MIRFNVYGTPRPKGSMTVFNGRAVQSGGAGLKKWEAHVRACARVAVGADPDQVGPLWHRVPIAVYLQLVLPRPASIKAKTQPWKRPDVDKLARAVLDGLSGVLFDDDARVVDLRARKFYQGDLDGFLGTGVVIAAWPL